MKKKDELLLIKIVIAFFLILPGCADEVSILPEDRLEQIEMGFPSVLGYVRIRPDLASALLTLEDMIQLPNMDSISPKMGIGDLLLPFMDRISLLCRPGSHINMVFVDPSIFGGPYALHFESDDAQKLVDSFEEDPNYDRIPGSDPPEFAWNEESGWILRVAGLLNALGIPNPGLGNSPFARVIIEDTSMGTLVLPSYDLKGDFLSFLEGTDFLSHWGDAALVVHIENGRLLDAFSESIDAWNTSLNGMLAKAERMTAGRDQELSAFIRAGQVLPALLMESTRSVAGYRFVSKAPASQGPEFCLAAVEGSALQSFFQCLRPDQLDLAGLIPDGLALQWNADPHDFARFLQEELGSLSKALQLDSAVIEANLPRLSMVSDSGQYLTGLVLRQESAYMAFISGLKENVNNSLPAPDSFWEPLLEMAFPNGSVVARSKDRSSLIQRFEVEGRGKGTSGRTLMAFESASSENLRITTVPLNARDSGYTQAILDLAEAGEGRIEGAPETADLFFRISFSMLRDILMPGIENIIPLTIMGKGTVEGNRLTIRFML